MKECPLISAGPHRWHGASGSSLHPWRRHLHPPCIHRHSAPSFVPSWVKLHGDKLKTLLQSHCSLCRIPFHPKSITAQPLTSLHPCDDWAAPVNSLLCIAVLQCRSIPAPQRELNTSSLSPDIRVSSVTHAHPPVCAVALTFWGRMGGNNQFTVRMAHLDPNRIVPQPTTTTSSSSSFPSTTRRSVPFSSTFLLVESGWAAARGGNEDAAVIGPWGRRRTGMPASCDCAS